MWSTFRSNKGKFLSSKINRKKFKGIIYMSLDCGLTWNYLGKRYPTCNVWTWCTNDTERIKAYMEYIHNNGYLPILYTLGGSEKFVEKVCKYISFQPPCFIGLELDIIHKIIVDSWINKVYEPLLPSIKSIFEDSIKYYNLGTSSRLDANISTCNANDLNIDININKYYKTPKLIILVGQQGSGKSCIASKFAKNGWFVIKEKESIKYMRSRNVSTLYTLISQIGENSGVGKIGVIVDSTNCLKKDRDFYIELAKKAKKKYIVGWVTRPGYFSNNKKEVKVSDIMLDKYSKLLEPLTKDENGVRFV